MKFILLVLVLTFTVVNSFGSGCNHNDTSIYRWDTEVVEVKEILVLKGEQGDVFLTKQNVEFLGYDNCESPVGVPISSGQYMIEDHGEKKYYPVDPWAGLLPVF